MSSFVDIKAVRLSISDPAGYIDIIEVAAKANLPAVPERQTVYRAADTGYYYATTLTTGATTDDYTPVDIRVSDARLVNWIDSGGAAYASCQALKQVRAQIGQELLIARNSTGAESVEYTRLLDMLAYYDRLVDSCEDDADEAAGVSTGRIGYSCQPSVAGGNV